jgi:SAM-dependent methyltransferase
MNVAIRKPSGMLLGLLPASAKTTVGKGVRQARRWVGIRWNRAEALLYDLRHGTDTTGSTPAAELDIPKEIEQHVTGFQSVNEYHLRKVLGSLSLPKHSTFVDIGCGKGKAVLIAAEYDFIDRAVGVELAGSLCRAAEANVRRMQARARTRAPIEIIHADATTVDYTRGENIFFLNNPFSWPLMSAMIDNVSRNLADDHERAWLLYGNPVHHEALAADGRLQMVREFKFFGPGRNIVAYRFR